MINALALAVFGFSSSLLGGVLGDKLEKKTLMIKSLIIMFGNTFATPLLAAAVFTSNFWLAIVCASLMILVSGAYYGPAVTMMQNTTRAD
jgi:MFS family permease